MARHKSALKAARHSLQRRAINKANKSRVRTTIKQTRSIVESGDAGKTPAVLSNLYSVLDRMTRRGTLHRNAAARLKSRLTKKAAAAKPAPNS